MNNEERDNLLISMSEKLDKHDNLLISMSKTLDKHDEMLAKHDEKLDKHDEMLSSIIKKMDEQHQEVMKELERQRMNMARMEYDLSEKIDALFVSKEVFEDRFKENEKSFETINNTLDWHDIRLAKLEQNS